MQKQLGLDGLFWLMSCVSLFSIVFAYFCVPETYGKTLEEIEEHYRNICYPKGEFEKRALKSPRSWTCNIHHIEILTEIILLVGKMICVLIKKFHKVTQYINHVVAFQLQKIICRLINCVIYTLIEMIHRKLFLI